MAGQDKSPKLFIVAGEPSGDQLGGKLMSALKSVCDGQITIEGVGGEAMKAQGLQSHFALSDITVMGLLAILMRYRLLRRRALQTVQAAIAAEPDAVVIIDSPEFTHRVASRIRKARPDIPIIDYVSPSVWAWRPGRARKMKRYVDHVLALLPFEPEVHERLGGPKCSYVGHPLIEKHDWMRNLDTEALAKKLTLDPSLSVLVMLPGSRASEVKLLREPFIGALGQLEEKIGKFEILVPTVPSVRSMVEKMLEPWGERVHFLEGEEDKFTSFRLANAALAASGTVTLELALANTPMVVAYRVEPLTAPVIRYLIQAQSIVLANLILGRNAFPEFIQEQCTPSNLAGALELLMSDSAERQAQLDALGDVHSKMIVEEETPSAKAAKIILEIVRAGRG